MKEKIKSYFSAGERALIGKDFAALWKSKTSRPILVLIPLILALVIPAVFLVAFCLIPESASDLLTLQTADFSGLPETLGFTRKQVLYYVFVELLTPLFFILIPAVTASFSTVFLFVGERENGTMESLIYSALPASGIVRAKFACIRLNSLIISLVSFLSISIINSIGNIILAVPFFFDLEWAVILFLITPGIIVFSTYAVMLLTRREKWVLGGFPVCGYIGAPFAIAFLGQFAGLFSISALGLFCAAVCIAAADVLLYLLKFRRVTDSLLIPLGTEKPGSSKKEKG